MEFINLKHRFPQQKNCKMMQTNMQNDANICFFSKKKRVFTSKCGVLSSKHADFNQLSQKCRCSYIENFKIWTSPSQPHRWWLLTGVFEKGFSEPWGYLRSRCLCCFFSVRKINQLISGCSPFLPAKSNNDYSCPPKIILLNLVILWWLPYTLKLTLLNYLF